MQRFGMNGAYDGARTLGVRPRGSYSYLSASIALIEAALSEGNMEKPKLRVSAVTKARTPPSLSKTNGSPTESLITRETGHETAIPNRPPAKAKATVSQVI